MTTDGSGNVLGTNLMSPYGETISSTTGDAFQFAGLYQDTEYGGDAATFRNYSTEQVRWLRPDPYNGSYDLTNPQSFNRYTYLNNNPLDGTDPFGTDGDSGCAPGENLTCPISLFFGWNGSSSSVFVYNGAAYATASLSMFGNFASDINSTLSFGSFLNAALQEIGAGFAIGDFIYNFGQMAGWWGQPPVFHGNVAASQLGKNLPGVASSVPNSGGWGDHSLAQQVFQGPGSGVFVGADTTVHGLAIATGAVAAAPFAVPAAASAAAAASPYAVSAGSTALTLSGSALYNPAIWQGANDFLEGYAPVGPFPATPAAFAGAVAGSWDTIWNDVTLRW